MFHSTLHVFALFLVKAKNSLSWSTCHYCECCVLVGTVKLVAPILARGWDHVKKTDHKRIITRTAHTYMCIHKALKDSEETMNSKSCHTYCAALSVH